MKPVLLTPSVAAVIERGTASQLDRAMKCAGSLVLPHVQQEPGEWALRGTRLHAFLEACILSGREAALASCHPSVRDEAMRIHTLELAGGIPEAAFGYFHESHTVVRYPKHEHRDYPEDGAFHMTLDVHFVSDDRHTIKVVDFKTGNPAVAASEAWQLKLAAVAMGRYYGADAVEVGFCYLREDGSWDKDEHTWDSYDFMGFEEDLAKLATRLEENLAVVQAGGQPELAAGPWCRYCRAIANCPAQTGMVKAITSDLGKLSQQVGQLTADRAGLAWARMEWAYDRLGEIKDALRLRAQTEPLPLPDGRWVKPIQMPIYILDQAGVERLVELKGMPAVLAATKLTKKQVAEAFGEEVTRQLDNEGFIAKKYTTQVRKTGKPRASR